MIYDLGGGCQIRALWNSYFCDVHGVIFVVDASDISRVEECKQELENLLRNDKLAGKPVLVLANKQDLPGALDEIDIVEALRLEPLVNEQKCLTLVEVCTAKPLNSRRKKIDSRLLNGYRWLLGQIIRNYYNLNMRVEYDSKEEAMRIERQRALWRQRMMESSEESGMIIPDNIQYDDGRKSQTPNLTSQWENRNEVENSNCRLPTPTDSDFKNMIGVIKEQFERKSAKQRNKMTLVRHNKVQPVTTVGLVSQANFFITQEEPSLALQALTSPRSRPKELPPLRFPTRPSTSRSLGNEGVAWDLHKDLEIVDTTKLGMESDAYHLSKE
ncbi:ADP-ribosylation factor-like protein 13B isoform X2 [Halyomorpha halys]|nr:ADP-ribosylation factor-like protein 13B isoform X2 [Halyomorpha halys]